MNDYHIPKITLIFYRKIKSHQKGKQSMVPCWQPFTTISICQEFWLQNIDFIIAIKYTNSKNMSLFAPGRLYYSCKLLVKDRNCDINFKTFYEPERTKGECFNRNDFVKSQNFLILRLKRQAPYLEQRWSSVKIFVIRQKQRESGFILRAFLQLAVLFASTETSQLWDTCSLNPA